MVESFFQYFVFDDQKKKNPQTTERKKPLGGCLKIKKGIAPFYVNCKFYFISFIMFSKKKKKMEQVTGIEPVSSPWQGDIITFIRYLLNALIL